MGALSAVDTSVTSQTWAALLPLPTWKYPPLVAVNVHDCAPVPLQAYCCTAVPLAVAAARASTHLPLLLLTTVYVVPETTAAGTAAGVVAAPASGITVMASPPATSAPAVATPTATARPGARGRLLSPVAMPALL